MHNLQMHGWQQVTIMKKSMNKRILAETKQLQGWLNVYTCYNSYNRKDITGWRSAHCKHARTTN